MMTFARIIIMVITVDTWSIPSEKDRIIFISDGNIGETFLLGKCKWMIKTNFVIWGGKFQDSVVAKGFVCSTS